MNLESWNKEIRQRLSAAEKDHPGITNRAAIRAVFAVSVAEAHGTHEDQLVLIRQVAESFELERSEAFEDLLAMANDFAFDRPIVSQGNWGDISVVLDKLTPLRTA